MQKTTEGKTVGQQGDDLLDECAKFLAHAVRDVMKMRCQSAISAVAEIDANFQVVITSFEGQPTSAESVITSTQWTHSFQKKERWAMSPAKRKGVG